MSFASARRRRKPWQQCERESVDLALVDMNYRRDSTSGAEGLDLIAALRQLDATLPIVALTAWGNVDLAVNAMRSGASDFIEKPWRNDALAGEGASRSSAAVARCARGNACLITRSRMRSKCRCGSFRGGMCLPAASSCSARAFRPGWWAATTSASGSRRRSPCTSAWPTFRAKALRER